MGLDVAHGLRESALTSHSETMTISRPMEVKFAVVADFASVTSDGKLNILGLFDQINPQGLPFVLPLLYIVVVFDAGIAEAGSNKNLRTVLMDADGRQVFENAMEFTLPPPLPGQTKIVVNQVLAVAGLRFEKPGAYQFSILIGDDEKRSIGLTVNQPQEATT